MNPNTKSAAAVPPGTIIPHEIVVINPETQEPVETTPVVETKKETKTVVETPKVTVTEMPKVEAVAVIDPSGKLSQTEKEILAKFNTLNQATQAYLNIIDREAARMSSGPDGESMSVDETHACQGRIYTSILNILSDTPEKEFNLAMYAVAALFKKHGESRVGGLSPERVMMFIGSTSVENGVTNFKWIPGKTEDDITWYRSMVLAFRTAYECGGANFNAMGQSSPVFALTAHNKIRDNQTVVNRIKRWFTDVKAF